MAHHQQGNNPRTSAILNMLRVSSTSNMPSIGEDEVVADIDEPPDDHGLFKRLPTSRMNSFEISPPTLNRRESLLTRGLLSSPEHSPEGTEFPGFANMASKRPPTASSHSIVSIPSTAELTSDGGITSPERSNTPSPPPPTVIFPSSLSRKAQGQMPPVAIADESKPHTPAVPASSHEAVVEANLGRKRCITFACGRQKAASEKKAEAPKPVEPAEPPKRKCLLTFACPSRVKEGPDAKKTLPVKQQTRRQPSPAPFATRKPSIDSHSSLSRRSSTSDGAEAKDLGQSEKTRFHEFEISHTEEDEWVNESTDEKPKITVNDCMKKEMAIRKIGEEAEEECREADEEDDAAENDMGFSDGLSDDGNESDNEEGFADSDDESDAGSDYHFWALSTTTAATSIDHLEHIRNNIPHRSISETSLDSLDKDARVPIFLGASGSSKRRVSKLRKFRPGTPDLPDSTDFVCGTLDEDRPLEAAYISCLEERKRSKHVLIPQDIDPSFPTSDPEEDDDDNDDDAEMVDEDDEEPLWMHGQMEGSDDDSARGRRKGTDHTIKTLSPTPKRGPSPAPRHITMHRSPPPPTKRTRSPAPALRLKSPPPPTQRKSLAAFPARQGQAARIAGGPRGCDLVRTNSLPRTPNPFFVRQQRLRDAAEELDATFPKTTLHNRRMSHTRGPIDIKEGLETKRQKRREKFWRQHCRKAAKEQQERKPVPGKGAERMKELGLEVAERFKGYGLGQQAQLVLSI
jgi:hypothetical protein